MFNTREHRVGKYRETLSISLLVILMNTLFD